MDAKRTQLTCKVYDSLMGTRYWSSFADQDMAYTMLHNVITAYLDDVKHNIEPTCTSIQDLCDDLLRRADVVVELHTLENGE